MVGKQVVQTSFSISFLYSITSLEKTNLSYIQPRTQDLSLGGETLGTRLSYIFP